jgi:hypothetical protein
MPFRRSPCQAEEDFTMTSCGDPALGPTDQDQDVRTDVGGWISGPGLDVPGETPASAPQDQGRLTIAQ